MRVGDLVKYITRHDTLMYGLVTRGGKWSVQVLLTGDAEPCWLSAEYLEVVSESR